MNDLAGKVALITGSTRGIGKATARVLGMHGATVVITGRTLADAERVAEELRALGIRAVSFALDVTIPESITEVMDQVNADLGGVDIMVNNAGAGAGNLLPHEIDPENWNYFLNLNLTGAHNCAKAAAPHMMEKKWGRIVFLTSMAAQVGGFKVGADYCAAKAGVIGLMRSYARKYGPFGITANAVSPGYIETEAHPGRDRADEVILRRVGTPDDVANAIYFLSSDLSSYITGVTIDVNGGVNIR